MYPLLWPGKYWKYWNLLCQKEFLTTAALRSTFSIKNSAEDTKSFLVFASEFLTECKRKTSSRDVCPGLGAINGSEGGGVGRVDMSRVG